MTYDTARQLVREAEQLCGAIEDRLHRASDEYSGDNPYNSWWTDKLEAMLMRADDRVRRRREWMKATT